MKYQLWTLRILRSCTHATWLHITTYMCGFYQCIINNNFKYSCIYAYKLTLYLSQSSIEIFKMYFKSNKCNNVHQITLKIEYSPPAKKVYIRGPLALRMHYQIHRLRTKKNWAQKLMTSQHTEIRLNIVSCLHLYLKFLQVTRVSYFENTVPPRKLSISGMELINAEVMIE